MDDYIGQDNPIRAVDQFVDSLDLAALKFKVKADSSPQKGRPGYHPATMLKLYLWGYLNQIRSIRKLERACGRNVEVMWLLQKMTPGSFDNLGLPEKPMPRLSMASSNTSMRCALNANFSAGNSSAMDGTFIKAVNSRHKSFTKTKLKKQIERVEKAISKWMKMLDTTDADDPGEGLNNADSTSGSKADATA